MSDVLSLVQGVLQEGGYRTWLTPLGRRTAVCFEDDAVMGFVAVFDDSAAVLNSWRQSEAAFLQQYVDDIRTAGDKAWNVYSVFLAAGAADPRTTREIRAIEEDLERTRKIAATGVTYREAVVAALLPLLPLQQQPALNREEVGERFRRRVTAIAPGAADMLLNENVSPKDVARRLAGSK